MDFKEIAKLFTMERLVMAAYGLYTYPLLASFVFSSFWDSSSIARIIAVIVLPVLLLLFYHRMLSNIAERAYTVISTIGASFILITLVFTHISVSAVSTSKNDMAADNYDKRVAELNEIIDKKPDKYSIPIFEKQPDIDLLKETVAKDSHEVLSKCSKPKSWQCGVAKKKETDDKKSLASLEMEKLTFLSTSRKTYDTSVLTLENDRRQAQEDLSALIVPNAIHSNYAFRFVASKIGAKSADVKAFFQFAIFAFLDILIAVFTVIYHKRVDIVDDSPDCKLDTVVDDSDVDDVSNDDTEDTQPTDNKDSPVENAAAADLLDDIKSKGKKEKYRIIATEILKNKRLTIDELVTKLRGKVDYTDAMLKYHIGVVRKALVEQSKRRNSS